MKQKDLTHLSKAEIIERMLLLEDELGKKKSSLRLHRGSWRLTRKRLQKMKETVTFQHERIVELYKAGK